MFKLKLKYYILALFIVIIVGLIIHIFNNNLKSYENNIINDKPLVLQGNEVLNITNTRYIQKNNIILKDNSRLVISNSLFEHRHNYFFQYTLEARNNAEVIVQNSEISSDQWLNWNFSDKTSLTLENVNQTFSGIWHSFAGYAKAKIKNARFHGTMNGETSFDIEDSPDVFIEFVYPPGAVVDERLPGKIAEYSFPDADDKNIRLNLKIKNSTATAWGITVNPKSNITIRDADPLIITFAVGSPWDGVTARLDNLLVTRYGDQTWRVEDTSLRLVNVKTGRWSPIAGNNNTLIVKNSELADNAFSWGNAKIIIENSSASVLRAKDHVEMTVKNSVIKGDVVAADNGKITLINTKVKGKIIKEGNGDILNFQNGP